MTPALRVALILLLGVSVGVRGTLVARAVLTSEDDGGDTARIENEVARVAAERDSEDVRSVDCSGKPYPLDAYECQIQSGDLYLAINYTVTARGDLLEVGPRRFVG
jgi:hypothetical protein